MRKSGCGPRSTWVNGGCTSPQSFGSARLAGTSPRFRQYDPESVATHVHVATMHKNSAQQLLICQFRGPDSQRFVPTHEGYADEYTRISGEISTADADRNLSGFASQ
ncbi:hypothetical protein G6F50_012971 [Rhizopus delemar]|uniref:Uncharacterized protein n=1 Tax=Rhizopus delemar TaxID=936053 RepID=A0A9P7CH72_9FUNG|nr:hypothetical protein G6F50_012971 [Rhizopus delemar]